MISTFTKHLLVLNQPISRRLVLRVIQHLLAGPPVAQRIGN